MKALPQLALTVALGGIGVACHALANTPFSHAGNAGWIGFDATSAHRVRSGPTFLSGFAYAANLGWIDFGDGTPVNGSAYDNTSAADFGVNHDGTGRLSGYAYGANVGWINFSWAGASDPNRPRVDLVTGVAAGFAYSGNVGWIALDTLTVPGVTASVQFPSGHSTTVAGSTLTLSAAVAGNETLAFQWFRHGVAISGGTRATLTLDSVQRFHAGEYAVRITRADQSMFLTTPATLTVNAPAPNNSRLLNLSTRARALPGSDILIPGFVISGTAAKRVLIRAVGPTLSHPTFGVPGALDNPRLALKRLNFATTPATYVDVAANDDWQTNSNADAITQTAAQLSAFAFADDREAALLVDLAPGQYTVFADGAPSTGSTGAPEPGSGQVATGIAIVELYDADPAAVDSRLINISNRGFCGVGDDVMIPGFVISSEGPKTFLVRVVGPTLGGFGVPGTMVDPKLEIFPAGSNTPILTNDNWGDNPDAAHTAAVTQQVSAFPLSGGSADAAFVVTLPPGGYTIVGSSAVAGATGVVLVEVYVAP